jgi:hypothetical protein
VAKPANLPLLFAELLAAGVLITKGARMFSSAFGGGGDSSAPVGTSGGGSGPEDLGQSIVGSPFGPAAIPGAAGVGAVFRAAQELANAHPAYVWGGGHGNSALLGADCSGAVSYVLNRAGLLKGSLTSSQFMSWGDAGPGRFVSIYASPTHVFMSITDSGGNVHWFGTSGFGHPDAPNGTGANWFTRDPRDLPGYLGGFTVRHPPGL